ncbi:nucleic acid-binding, OB-fold protein [Tanacetum coccineum]
MELIVMDDHATVNPFKHQLEEDLDNYDKNGKTGKKKPLTLLDDEGNEINCIMWGDFAQQLTDFLNTCGDHGRINLVLQLAMMMFWDGKFYDI